MPTKTHFNSILMVRVIWKALITIWTWRTQTILILISINRKMTLFKCRSIPLWLIMVNLFNQNRRDIIMILCSLMKAETQFLITSRSYRKIVLIKSMVVICSTRNHSISAFKTWRERGLRSRRVNSPSQASWSSYYKRNLMALIKRPCLDGKSLDLLILRRLLEIHQTTQERPCRQQVQSKSIWNIRSNPEKMYSDINLW